MSRSLFAELKRRNVIRVAGLYLVGAWLVTQVASTVLPMFGAADWLPRSVVILLAIGFVPTLILSWIYELTPDGLRRDADVPSPQSIGRQTGRRIDRMIIVVLIVALVYFAVDKFVLSSHRQGVEPTDAQGNSIAVLPFVDMSQSKDQEYFSDGLSEELLDLLAKVPQLKVIARTSSFSFKGKNADVATIAKTLNVASVLEGSVRKSGNTLRVTAQLIRTADSTHLWSDTYDREFTDVFKVQDDIAAAVVAALKLKLLPAQQAMNAHGTDNTEAYDLFLLGRNGMRMGQFDRSERSVVPLQRAVELDPRYALAWAWLGVAQGAQADFAQTLELRQAGKVQALASAQKAIELAPDLADGYRGRANLRFTYFKDWKGAESDFERALALDSRDSDVLVTYAAELGALGRYADALKYARRASGADPLSMPAWLQIASSLWNLQRKDEARAALQRAIDISPAAAWPRFGMGMIELHAGNVDPALEQFSHAGDGFRQTGIAMAEFTRGNEAASRQALDELEARFAAGFAYQIAQVHAWRGEKDLAFQWLDRAYSVGDAGMTRLRGDEVFAPLRDDPRYAELVKKMGFPQ